MINIFINIFCSFELVLAHVVFFQRSVDLLSINSAIIFIQAFFLYGLLFTFGKKAVISFAVFANILILLLLVYHRFYATPIMLSTISSQYGEGMTYLSRALSVFLSWYSLGFVVYLTAIIIITIKYYRPWAAYWTARLIFGVPLLIILALSYTTYHRNLFFDRHFKNYAEIFGYPQGWLYELITNSDMDMQLDFIIDMANEPPLPLPEELQVLKPHNHVYLIQIESFQYDAFTKEVDGKKIMPFLNSIAKNSSLYQILPKNKHPSANSDFAAMAGVYNISDFYYVIYKLVSPEELYSRITPITWKYKEQGYHSEFYHGFIELFYNRGPHIRAMKFDEIYFLNNLSSAQKFKTGDWGVEDLDLARFIIKNQKRHPVEKSLTFFITVSSHDPFDNKAVEDKIYRKPQSLVERYYNSFHYVDQALEHLITNAPQDSLFLLYSDHPSVEELPMDTFFMVYSNRQNLGHFAKINFDQTMQIVKSLLHKNLQSD